MDNKERISKELLNEDASIWFIEQLNELSILIKAPLNICKSLINGCQIQILLGKDNTLEKPIIHTGIKIFDDITNPVILTGAHRYNEENSALIKILKSEHCLVGLHNELGLLVASGKVVLDKVDRLKAIEMIGDEDMLYFGDLTETVTSSLDSFDYTIDNSRQFKAPYIIDLLTLNCQFNNWINFDSHLVGLIEQPQINISDKEEGETFEKHIWFSIESLFPFSIYLNPKFKTTKADKELTDILAFYDLGIFLIEAKSLSIFAQSEGKSMDKKVNTLKQHISKAINQLIGAKNKIEKHTKFYDTKGDLIEFERNIVPHCIVLVSELFRFGNWNIIQNEIRSAICESKINLNVMDFREFMTLVKNCKGEKEYLDYFLTKRTEMFLEHDNIHIRMVITDNTPARSHLA